MKRFVTAIALLITAAGLAHNVSVAHAGQTYAECSIVDVATFNNRVHLHCTAPVTACGLTPGGCKGKQDSAIAYYAVEVASPMASQVIQIGLAAFVAHRTLGVFYDDNASANPAGCNTNDCRRIIGVVYK